MRHYSDELDFVSVIIPSYQRWHYLEEVVESIHQNADIDVPFEIVIHDDCSSDGTNENILFRMKDKVSTVILNNGVQLGLAESINRAVRVAGSNYIIMLNADCRLESSIFKDVVNVLKCPFIGNISLMSVVDGGDGGKNMTLMNEGTKFQLLRGMGAGAAQAFTKETFEKVGGWYSHNVASSNADVSFMIRLIKAGYFTAALSSDGNLIKNLSLEREKGLDSTISRGYYDCSFPKLFNLHKSKFPVFDFQSGDEIYKNLSRKRNEDASNAMQITYREEGGDTNLDYWHKFVNKLIKEDGSIDAEISKKCGHNRWIDEIDRHKR